MIGTGIAVTIKVSKDLIRGLLCCAFEGGSDYWIDSVIQGRKPKADKPSDTDEYWHYSQWWPTDGGSVVVVDNEDNKKYTLNGKALERGLQVMAEKFTKHFADAISGNDDAETGDAFLQCCIFGDVIYG